MVWERKTARSLAFLWNVPRDNARGKWEDSTLPSVYNSVWCHMKIYVVSYRDVAVTCRVMTSWSNLLAWIFWEISQVNLTRSTARTKWVYPISPKFRWNFQGIYVKPTAYSGANIAILKVILAHEWLSYFVRLPISSVYTQDGCGDEYSVSVKNVQPGENSEKFLGKFDNCWDLSSSIAACGSQISGIIFQFNRKKRYRLYCTFHQPCKQYHLYSWSFSLQ